MCDKKSIFSFILGLGIVLSPGFLAADAPPDACSKELLISYFPQVFVTETLKKFDIPHDKWDSIIKGLADKDPEVLRAVEDKASKMEPNPFKDRSAQQRQIAVKIFRETLFEKFNDVLKANGITDAKQVQAMLDDIALQKAKNFAACIEKQKHEAPEIIPEAPPAEQKSPQPAPAPH